MFRIKIKNDKRTRNVNDLFLHSQWDLDRHRLKKPGTNPKLFSQDWPSAFWTLSFSLSLSNLSSQVYTRTYIEGNNIEKLIEKKLINSAIIVTEYNIIPLIAKFPDTPSSIANRVYVHALARFRYGSLVTYRGTIKAYYQFASGAKFRWPWTRPREPFHFDRTRWGRMFLTVHETDREREREREFTAKLCQWFYQTHAHNLNSFRPLTKLAWHLSVNTNLSLVNYGFRFR